MKQLVLFLVLIVFSLTIVSCGGDSVDEVAVVSTATAETGRVIEEDPPVKDVSEEAALEEESEAPEAEEEPAEEEVAASAVAVEGQDIELTIEGAAQLFITDGGLEPGSEVAMRAIPESEWTEPPPEHSQTGQVFEIVAEGQTNELQASLTLKIDDPNMTDEELEDVQLADYQNGSWVTLPSTVDVENRTVTATTTHFSWKTWIRRLSNSKPEVTIAVSPNIYAGVSLDDRTAVNIEDLIVDVYVVDPENDDLTVMATYGIETVADMAIEEMNKVREHHLDTMVVESVLEGASDIEVAFVLNTAETLRAPKKMPRLALEGWYELPEIETGHYQLPLRPNNLGVLESALQEIVVYVRVWDSVEEDFIEIPVEVRVTGERMATPPDLNSPGPSVLTLCPPQPTFRWQAQDAVRLGSFGFRLVKGDDVWGAWRPKYEWSCTSEDDCNKDGPEDFFASGWTPPEPLDDGVYSWGMMASADKDERKFKNDLSTHSDIYQFTVDSSLDGNECVTREQNVPNWATIGVGEDGAVVRSDVVGKEEYSGLQWVIVGEDGGEGTRLDATESELLDMKTAAERESGDLTVWIEATYGEQPYRISNELLVEQEAPLDQLITDDQMFEMLYEQTYGRMLVSGGMTVYRNEGYHEFVGADENPEIYHTKRRFSGDSLGEKGLFIAYGTRIPVWLSDLDQTLSFPAYVDDATHDEDHPRLISYSNIEITPLGPESIDYHGNMVDVQVFETEFTEQDSTTLSDGSPWSKTLEKNIRAYYDQASGLLLRIEMEDIILDCVPCAGDVFGMVATQFVRELSETNLPTTLP